MPLVITQFKHPTLCAMSSTIDHRINTTKACNRPVDKPFKILNYKIRTCITKPTKLIRKPLTLPRR